MSNVVFTLSLFAFAFCVSKVHSCYTYGHSNGCSIPAGLPYFYKDIFKPDCDRHDICYACGNSYGISRTTCDNVFVNNLIRRCSIDRRVRLDDFCRSVAVDSYYTGVRLFGTFHYNNPSPYWCGQRWVRGCL